VRTRQVRAMTEKFWGRTARTFMFETIDGELPSALWFVREAHAEIERALQIAGPQQACDEDEWFSTFRHARIPAERVKEFNRRLDELSLEFVGSERGGNTMFGLLISMFPTDLPTLPDAADARPESGAP
jgi:hypothetical protein